MRLFDGYAQQLVAGNERNWMGEVAHEVHAAVGKARVEDLVDVLAHTGSEALYGAEQEASIDEWRSRVCRGGAMKFIMCFITLAKGPRASLPN